MIISIDPETYVISILQSELTSLGGVSYQLDTNVFRIALKDWEDNEEGIYQPKTHTHNTTVLLGGIQYARVMEILSPYTITFEETGTPYSVALTGSNNNILEKTNLGTVQILSNNSAGLINITEVQYSAFEGMVAIDADNGIAGTSYPTGTHSQPVNNLADAVIIAIAKGFRSLHFLSNFTFPNGTVLSGYELAGQGLQKTTFTFESGCILTSCEILNAEVTGYETGVTGFENCLINDLDSVGLAPSSISVFVKECLFKGTITLPSNYSGTLTAVNCWAVPDVSGTPPIIDMGNSTANIQLRNFSGLLSIRNNTNTNDIRVFLSSGNVTLESTITAGNFIFAGTGNLINNSTSVTSLDISGLVSKDTVSDAVWDETTASHTTAGTTGKALSDAGAAGNPWGSPVEGNTSAGSFGELVGKKLLTIAKFLGLK